MDKLGFDFPVDTSGQWDGFNDPGIEHFSGNPFQHLGREVPQNTLDARLSGAVPAKIVISLESVLTREIPDVAALRRAIDACHDAAKNDNSDKAVKFFERARRLLSKAEIPVLKIADYNTTGVKGPCTNGTPFFAMMKATGQSKKADTSTGSYGIGKFAPYTVSALRTIFLTTVWKDDLGDLQHYVQGKSVLMSHAGKGGKTHRGTGFWGGLTQCQPVVGHLDKLPPWLRRNISNDNPDAALGTTLSIIGFDDEKHWQDILAANIVENFFGAIYRGELSVEITGSHCIDRSTINELVQSDFLKESIDDEVGEPQKFLSVRSYLKALEDGDHVSVAETENVNLGRCSLRIMVAEGLPKRVVVLRNGMFITDGLQGLKRFGDFKDFVAVFECHSVKGLSLLRAMEPPKHDAFEPDRLDQEKRSQGRAALRDIAIWVRDKLKLFAQDPVSEETNLDELSDFFADEADESQKLGKDENPKGNIVVRARAMKHKAAPTLFSYNSGSHGEYIDDDTEVDGEQDGPGAGDAEGGTGSHLPNTSEGGNGPGNTSGGANPQKRPSGGLSGLKDVRGVVLSATRRRIAFTPTSNGGVNLQLENSGADSNYPLRILSSNIGTVSDGNVKNIVAKAGERIVVDVDLDEEFLGTVRVIVSAV